MTIVSYSVLQETLRRIVAESASKDIPLDEFIIVFDEDEIGPNVTVFAKRCSYEPRASK